MILLELSILIFVIWIIPNIIFNNQNFKKKQLKKLICFMKTKASRKFEELQMPKKNKYVTIERENDELFT